MSRQEKRANDRKLRKALGKITLAAGEGVGRAVAFSFALASNAVAAEPQQQQEETFTLPPVVVQEKSSPYVVPQSSLSKLPEPILDTPQSITIVPEKLIEEQGGSNLRDALRNVTGIGVTAGEGGGAQGDAFTLRGFNARNDMFIDGVRDQGSYFRDSFNLESVEVLKGPSSVYFGRGSTGGIINQVSKTPRLDPFYSVIFSGGSDFYLRGTADVNQPLTAISPNAALRVNLMGHRNDVAGRDVVDNKRFGFAPSMAFGLGTPTQITGSYFLQHEHNIPDYGFPYANGKPVRVDRDTYYGLADDDREDTWVNIGTLRLDHRFNEIFSLRNTFRYSYVDRDSRVTNAMAVLPNTLNRSRPQRDTEESILSNQADLTAKFNTYGFDHTATAGMEVSRETFNVARWASAGPGTTIHNPNDHLPSSPKTLAADSDTRSIGFGIYAADQIKLNQYFEVLGGVRWDYFDTHVNNNFPQDDNNKQIDKMWSYRGGLIFHPTPAQSLYFSYGTSFNPSAEANTLNAANNGTPPEKNQIFEVGAKLEFFQGALLFQTAAFRIVKTNARTPNPFDPTLPNVITGKQRSQGFEVGVTGRVFEGLNVFGGYTYLDTKILKDNVAANVGNEIANAPQHSATLWTTYDCFEKWQVGGGPTYVGGRYANNANTNRVPGFVRWDSTIAYQVTRNIQLRINAMNITNELYFDSISGSKAVPGASRTIIGSASFNF